MDFFTVAAILVHIIAILILLSTLPRQLHDIWAETDTKYRKICWVIFLGTFCLIAMNGVPLMQVLFYESSAERIFWNIVNTFNGLIGVGLGSLAHMMFRSTKLTVPRTIDDIDRHHKKHVTPKPPRGDTEA